MYIEQVKTKNFNFILYLPFSLVFLLLIIPQFFVEGTDTNTMIQLFIDQFGKNITFIILVLPLSLFCVALLLWVKFFHKQSITSLTTARKKIDWGRIWFSFGLWGAVLLITTLIGYFSSPENFEINFQPVPFFTFLVLAIILLPLQTSFEEYFFRGYLMQGLGVATNSRLFPLLFTSIVFGLMHLANPEVGQMGMIMMVFYIGTGLLLGIMTLMDDGLELALGFHAANNIIGALLVTSDWSALQTHSILKELTDEGSVLELVLPVLFVYPVILFVLGKKYGWKNWKEKLTGSLNPNINNLQDHGYDK